MAIHEVHFKCHNIELSPSPIFFWLLLYLPMRLGLIWWLIFCLNCVLQKVWENALKFHRSIWIRLGSSLFFFVFCNVTSVEVKKKLFPFFAQALFLLQCCYLVVNSKKLFSLVAQAFKKLFPFVAQALFLLQCCYLVVN